MNKNFKIWGMRQSLIGDSIMSLPILNYLHKAYNNPYIYFQIARKCSQAAPLYFNHDKIDQLVISDCNEGFGPRDIEIMKNCNLCFDTMPKHPEGDSWPNKRNIFEETWIMAGLKLEEYYGLSPEERRPKLTQWFNVEKTNKKSVALWCGAGYGKERGRAPSKEWYKKLIDQLLENNILVYQFGHPNDFNFITEYYLNDNYQNVCHWSFFEQIKASLGFSIAIGTDSGSTLAIGAYSHPTISLLTNHWPTHTENPYAFATNNPNNFNFFAPNGCDNISVNAVLEKVKDMIK